MKIEVWSDYVCPFCYIGKRRLETALKQEGLEGKVQVQYKAYQLDPNTAVASDQPLIENLAAKFSISKEEAGNMLKNIQQQAKTVGLDFQIDKMKTANTFDAHRLVKFAAQRGAGEEVTERLLCSYFTEGEHIDTVEVLEAIAKETGMDSSEVKAMLETDEYANEVQKDIEEARQIGVQGVPFFVINRKYALSGAQPVETFAKALKKAAEEEGITPSLRMIGEEGGSCDDGSCRV